MGDLKNLSVEGTVILVTGGTSGIGKVVTSTLCAQGASVVFTGRNETAGETILTDLRNVGHDCHFVPADLRDQEGITKVVDTCLSIFGRLDVAFNNARQAALQYANAGIRINSISPGPTFTETHQSLADKGPDAVADHLGTLNPRAQFISPDQIADVVLFLARSAPDMLTGQDIAIDGGQLYKL